MYIYFLSLYIILNARLVFKGFLVLNFVRFWFNFFIECRFDSHILAFIGKGFLIDCLWNSAFQTQQNHIGDININFMPKSKKRSAFINLNFVRIRRGVIFKKFVKKCLFSMKFVLKKWHTYVVTAVHYWDCLVISMSLRWPIEFGLLLWRASSSVALVCVNNFTFT